MDLNTALILLIAVGVIVIAIRQRDCDERVRAADLEGERRMLAAIHTAKKFLIEKGRGDNSDPPAEHHSSRNG